MTSSAKELAELIPLIERNQRVGVDTEADSLHCYREKLCLLQISLPEGDYLVDPLAKSDLSAVTAALARKEIVLHGADYDLRMLRRGLGFRPSRIFDTMIAARLIGMREFSYAALVEKYFRTQLTKASQKANWAQRPLSAQMERYARNDTHYLLPLAERLEQELAARGRLEWFHQSCGRAVVSTATDRERDMEEAWRIRGAGLIHGRAAAVLRAIWKWRDREAERADRPAFHILRNEQLIEAAESAANGKFPRFRHLSVRRAESLAAVIREALALPEEKWPNPLPRRGVRPTKEMERVADEMRRNRDESARELGIEPSFIAPRASIDAIAAGRVRAHQLLVPWQRKLLGDKAQETTQ